MITTPAPSTRGSKKKCKDCGLRGKHAPGCAQVGCEYCGMQVGHADECPQNPERPTRCPAEVDGVRCQKDAPHDGEPHQGKDSSGTLTWGFPDMFESEEPGENGKAADEKVADDGTITTTVDGQDATVVLDGKSGAPKSDAGEQLALLQGDPDEILKRLRAKREDFVTASLVLAEREEAHKEQKKLVELIQRQLNVIVAELCDATSGSEQSIARTADEPADDAADEPADGEEAALTGAEHRALQMTDEPEEPAEDERPQEQTEPISQRHPGVYVSAEEGPEE